MEPVTPYLNFNGNAAEALALYAKAFDGEVVFQQTYGNSPMEGALEVWKDKLMHAFFKAGNLTLMVSDIMKPEDKVTRGTNMQLSLNFQQEADIDRVFAVLSEGAKITMPLQDTFWGAKFGMLVDKFDINWMFNFDREPKNK